MAVEPLSAELKTAGQIMLAHLDRVGLSPQGALWLMFPHIKDWRYTVVSDLVDDYGRIKVYGLIDEALSALPPVDGLTLFDIHLASTSEIMPMVLDGLVAVDNGVVHLNDCRINDVKVDAVVFRLQQARPVAVRKKAIRDFQRAARKAHA